MKQSQHPPGHQTGKSLIILAVALLLLVGQAGVFLYEGVEIRTLEAQQELAGRELQRLRDVLTDLQDAETGQRGYLLTGVESYLEPYRRGSSMLDQHLQEASSMLLNEPQYGPVMAQLRLRADNKLAELKETIELYRNGQQEAALRRVQGGNGKAQMDGARANVVSASDAVRSARTVLNADISRRISRAAYVLVSIAATIVAMVCVATVQMMRIIHRNAELRAQLEKESTHDALTGLANRRLFYSWLDKTLVHAARKRCCPAVMFIDLDGFKAVNDQFGHKTGDAVLLAASARLAQVVRQSDLLARLGGDEFAIVVNDDPSREALAVLATRIIEALRPPLLPALAPGAVGASIGVALFPVDGERPETLIGAADEAMYAAKRSGKACFRFAATSMPMSA